MDSEKNSPKILLFPFLAHGHVSPFCELAKKLSTHNFVVYFCSTPVILEKFARKFDGYSIKLVDYNLETPPELPPHFHTTTGLPPLLSFPLIEALQNSSHTFSEVIKSVQPDLVIYDLNQRWLPNLASTYDIPAVYFQTSSATSYSFPLHKDNSHGLEFPSTAIFDRDYEVGRSRQRVDPPTPHDDEQNKRDFYNCLLQSNEIILIRSSKSYEERYIDFESLLLDKKMVSVGSLVSEPKDDTKDGSEIIQWLNGKEEASTVYVSFGSEIYLTKEELKEIALGLEMSNVNFIWVVRSTLQDNTRLDEVLPAGFLDRIKGKGFIENVWAPQDKILKHPSIGAFVSHCGWGSTVESISFGVPIIAMPMQYDQPMNARLLEELGVGLEVVGKEMKGEEIGRIIRKVLLKEEGETIRKNSRDLCQKSRVKSEEEFDVAVQELRRIICDKKKN